MIVHRLLVSRLLLVIGVVGFCFAKHAGAQIRQESSAKMPSDSLYNENIKKSRLYGVYIPRDVEDALVRLDKLTDETAREPLKKIHEDTMARKLFFGLGRWMEYNWNFEEGSRFSHYLRKKGLVYTEDMTRFMLITYHRHITGKDLKSESLVKRILDERKKKQKKAQDQMPVIHSETKILPSGKKKED